MPRRPAPANLEHPIRKLRAQLKITQARLAQILGFNGDEIRNLENGRSQFTYDIEKRINFAVGAEYAPDRKLWLLYGSNKPCDGATFMMWRQSAQPDDKLKALDLEALSYRLRALLAYARNDEYNMVVTKISKALEDCLEEHPNRETKEAFKKSRVTGIRISALVSYQDYTAGHFKPDPLSVIQQITRIYKDMPSTGAELTQNPKPEQSR